MPSLFGSQQSINPNGEIRAYQPTLRDMLARFLLQGADKGSGREHAVMGLLGSRGIGNEGAGLVNYTPAGIPMMAQEAGRQIGGGIAQGSPIGIASGMFGAAMAGIPGGRGAEGAAKTVAEDIGKRALNDGPEIGIAMHDAKRLAAPPDPGPLTIRKQENGLYHLSNDDVSDVYDTLAGAKQAKWHYENPQQELNLNWQSPTPSKRVGSYMGKTYTIVDAGKGKGVRLTDGMSLDEIHPTYDAARAAAHIDAGDMSQPYLDMRLEKQK